jgi:diguanylate cyclase (GGDEF)-like protein
MKSIRSRGGRITRRMVALFVACALVPVAATLVIAYGAVHDLLVAQRVGFLRYEAGAYGTSLVERLNMADAVARNLSADILQRNDIDGLMAAQDYFRSAIIVDAATTRVLLGKPTRTPALAELKANQPPVSAGYHLVLTGAGTPQPEVWLVQRLASRPAWRYLALQLNPDFLWSGDELPYQTSVCVLSAAREPLKCNGPLSAAARDALRKGSSGPLGEFAWHDGDDDVLSGYREVFLRARFGAASWVVVASQPAAYVMAPVHSLGWLVVPLVILGLLVAALLGLVQVRRVLAPLKPLVEATSRVAGRDFSARLPAARDDEFGALAGAFNTMSERLGRQFSALQAHSEINAVILSNMDLAHIATIVLRWIGELAAADRYWLLLAQPDCAESYALVRANDEAGAGHPTLALPEAERARLLAAPEGTTELPGMPERHLYAVPVVMGSQFCGALVLGYDAPRHPDDEEVSLLRDLADRVAVALATARRDEELYRRANYDALTGLPNRLLGSDALSRAVASAARDQRMLAVLFVDLDDFAAVNDSAGHAAGDRLLAETSARLRGCMRSSDLVMRLGGDEFAVVLTELRDPGDAALVARHIIDTLSRPYAVRETSIFVSASVGIAVYPDDGGSAEELLQHADLAMYKAKEAGRRQFAFFEASMNEEVRHRTGLASELRAALEREEFVLHFQPQLHLSTDRIVGAEALLRWRHPQRGLVAPAYFIAFAESSGLIEEMGRWALAAACAQFVAWQRERLALERISVNVSPRQLRKPGFAQVVAEALRRADMPASALRLELTESAVLEDTGAVTANLAALIELGVTLELDDFGTGYSSLAYLQRLPVAAVKLDRLFIRTIQASPGTRAVVRAAVDMVHALGKDVVAEGVEQEGQLSVLAELGCDLMQGYLLSPPIPADGFSRFVTSRPSRLLQDIR